jgi:hypothetical protein
MNNIELKTYGDLKKLINSISNKKTGQKIIYKGAEIALDTALGFLGAGAAKNVFDLVKAGVSRPDDKKTKTWLDKLDIDDDMSSIVDDTVENGFIKMMSDIVKNQPDNKELEDDFNMNQKLVNYLSDKYNERTVTGIKENKMKTTQLRQFIREEIQNIIEATSTTSQTNTPQGKIQGANLNIELIKKLVPNINPQFITSTINLVKQNKSLNNAANKVLADLMIAMIKTSDDALLSKIFQNLKQMEVK